MVTICSLCGKNLTARELESSRFVICPHCNINTPKGANSYKNNKVKGGEKMEKVNEKKEKNISNIDSSDKLKSKQTKKDNTDRLKKFIETELKLDKIQSRKILSRLYSIYTKEIKKN